jgi:hypothetical protein
MFNAVRENLGNVQCIANEHSAPPSKGGRLSGGRRSGVLSSKSRWSRRRPKPPRPRGRGPVQKLDHT